jgi:DNA-binding XRE family transcriptional regulator
LTESAKANKLLGMSDERTVQITGSMLRAARGLVGLSQQEVAQRANVTRPTVTVWEGSSDAVPNANCRAFGRVVEVLETQGVRFRHDGVYVERAIPRQGVTIHSEAVA